MPKIQASPALARLRILDLTRVRAGPTCVRQFADFGADVIKVETPGEEDLGGAARRLGLSRTCIATSAR
jgi:crotonobetainyl-CoA:carnitine CoA-transferase CaiB-like acyl-CoA transferase